MRSNSTNMSSFRTAEQFLFYDPHSHYCDSHSDLGDSHSDLGGSHSFTHPISASHFNGHCVVSGQRVLCSEIEQDNYGMVITFQVKWH